MSLVIRVYLVGICNSLLVEEHISLGICVSLVGEHMSLDSDMGKGKTYHYENVFPWKGNTYH